jgi:glycosyltransferase involved in cell wall biosynthesis
VNTQSISIAMATYNGASYISKQLESFVSQIVLPSELVVTDDGSTDRTFELIEDFAATAPFPVRIERNATRLGFKANFMKAAGLCRSDYIAFSDQDDIWLPGKLESCLAAFDRDEILLAYHNATVVTEDLVPIGSLDQRAPRQDINECQTDPWHYGLGFTLVFRRSLLSFTDDWLSSVDFHYISEREAHDQWFYFLASCFGTIAYISEPQVLYRQHRTNAFGWRDSGRSFSGMLKNVMHSDVKDLRFRKVAAASRAALLENSLHGLSDDQRRRVSATAAGYRKLETSYRLREEMYQADRIFSRMLRLLGLLRHGSYRSRAHWGVGKKAMVRDAICNVVLRNRDNSTAVAANVK